MLTLPHNYTNHDDIILSISQWNEIWQYICILLVHLFLMILLTMVLRNLYEETRILHVHFSSHMYFMC